MEFASRNKGHIKVAQKFSGKSRTEQHHKKECDINQIVKKYDKTGLLNHVNSMDGIPDDMLTISGLDYKQAMDLMLSADKSFAALPSDIRNRFQNDPGKLIQFVQDESNYDEALGMGLVKQRPPEPTSEPPKPPDENNPPHPEA